jgi:hypothetical protein
MLAQEVAEIERNQAGIFSVVLFANSALASFWSSNEGLSFRRRVRE